MGTKTGIEWTDATWNPIRGCSMVSAGCTHCYAQTVAHRFSGPGQPYAGLVQLGADGKSTGKWNGAVRFVEEHLLDPLRWKTPRRIFVNSMSDLFHENVTDEMRDRIFAVMALCPQHSFQVLTKLPERMLAYVSSDRRGGWAVALDGRRLPGIAGDDSCRIIDEYAEFPLPNVWLGVSVESRKHLDRIELLRETPAAVRYLSLEPLLEDLGAVDLTGIDWVIVGGESGPGARPMHPYWARSLRDQCVAAGVPFFFKQWGEWSPEAMRGQRHLAALVNGDCSPYDPQLLTATQKLLHRVGKKAAGDLLDGVGWHQMPEVRE